MQQITDLELYLIDIINEKYIDLDNSFIGNNGEIFLKIKIDILPIPHFEIKTKHGLVRTYYSVKEVLERFINPSSIEQNNYYIVCDFTGKPIDLRGTTNVCDKIIGVYNHCNIINEILTTMNDLKYPDYTKYSEQTKVFSRFVRVWISNKIRISSLFDNTKGEFVADGITGNVYLQRRNCNNEDIFYIIPEWWDNLASGMVEWTDVDNGDEKTFVSVRC